MEFIKRNEKKLFHLAVFVIVCMAVVHAFFGLTQGEIYDIDEARYGVNAYEMIENYNYMEHTYDGSTDYENLKPPLSMWLLVFTFKLFGFNLLGLRILSAVLLPVVTLISMVFLGKYVGHIAALVAGLLFALAGPRFHHLFKTGDPDALFLLLCMLACIYLYRAYSVSDKKLIGTGVCIAFAFLTKGLHILPLVLVVTISIFALKKVHIFSTKSIVLYLCFPAVFPCLVWALWRYSTDGMEFLGQMLTTDVFGRAFHVVDGHSGSIGYYVASLTSLLGGWLTIGILLAWFIALMVKVTSETMMPEDLPFAVIFSTMLLCPLILFSLAKTKQDWYIYPALTSLFFLTGYALQYLTSKLLSHNRTRLGGIVVLSCCTLLMVTGFIFTPDRNIRDTKSPSSANCIFMVTDHPEYFKGRTYYAIDIEGNSEVVPPSWLLHAYFIGLYHATGDYDAYMDNASGNLLIVSYDTQEEADAFMEQNPHLYLTAQNDGYLLFR